MKPKLDLTIALTVCISSVALTGCDYNNLVSDVKDFNTAVLSATTSLRTTYTGMNDHYRKTYIIARRMDATKPVLAMGGDKQVSALVYQIDPFEIRARELALQAIAEYSGGLAALAGSDAPDKAAELAAQLSQRVVSTSDTLTQLQKPSTKSGKSFDISTFSAPIGDLAKITAKYWVRGVQTKALKESIAEGSPKAIAVLQLLRSDITTMFDAAYTENAEYNLIQSQIFYNQLYTIPFKPKDKSESDEEFAKRRREFFETNKEKIQALLKDKDRTIFLDELEARGKELETLRTTNPIAIIDSLIHANQSLLNYVNKPEKGGLKSLNPLEHDTSLKDTALGEASAVASAIRNTSAGEKQ